MGNAERTQRFLEFGLDVNEQEFHGRTEFDRTRQWCKDIALTVARRGADPVVVDNDGHTSPTVPHAR